jgi:uncharacterized protein
MSCLETSALVKLIRREPESDALADWLDTQTTTPWLTSTLAKIELPRALCCTNPQLLSLVQPTIARLAGDIDEVVRAAAAAYPDPRLRAPDAIYFATAEAVFGNQLTSFVSYDERPPDAATAIGLPAYSAGR